MRDERGIDQRRLDQFFEHRARDFKIFVTLGDVAAQLEVLDGARAAFGGANVNQSAPRPLFADEVLVFGARQLG
jgi:hypothetical protein